MSEYAIGPTLGSGSQGCVTKVMRKSTGFIYALKEIIIPLEKRHVLQQQEREIECIKILRHDGILNLLAFSVDKASKNYVIRILMPLCKMSLDKIIPDKSIFREFMRQCYKANVLLLDGQPYRYVLTDFGYANKVRESTTICSTPGYMAPEILHSESYDAKSDIFSIGVVGLEIRGIFKGIQEEVRDLPEGWFTYQYGRQVGKRIDLVNDALIKGKLPDKNGWYRLLTAITRLDPKARPTALEALFSLTPPWSAYPTKRSTACFGPVAEYRSEDPKAILNSSKATAKPPPATSPISSIRIYEDVTTRPSNLLKAIHGSRPRKPIQRFRLGTNE
ncbi:MAG: hypothetical protein Q9209_007890 [Squamulea sp. 1 TL-2023]